jgi:hypothetical protein
MAQKKSPEKTRNTFHSKPTAPEGIDWTFSPNFSILYHSVMDHPDSIPQIPSDSSKALQASLPLPVILQKRLEERLVETLLEKALTRLEDLLDVEDDNLVQKTATYLVDLGKELAGFRGKGSEGRTSGINVAIFNPGYLTKLASEAQKVIDGEVIEIIPEGD